MRLGQKELILIHLFFIVELTDATADPLKLWNIFPTLRKKQLTNLAKDSRTSICELMPISQRRLMEFLSPSQALIKRSLSSLAAAPFERLLY